LLMLPLSSWVVINRLAETVDLIWLLIYLIHMSPGAWQLAEVLVNLSMVPCLSFPVSRNHLFILLGVRLSFPSLQGLQPLLLFLLVLLHFFVVLVDQFIQELFLLLRGLQLLLLHLELQQTPLLGSGLIGRLALECLVVSLRFTEYVRALIFRDLLVLKNIYSIRIILIWAHFDFPLF
jgi:hypothetical protein